MHLKKKPSSASNLPLSPPSWHRAWALGLGLLILIAVGIRFAEPLPDGDLWWHMAYARYMIENGTLVPDHTVFSWTPSEGDNVKVDWLAEIVLYGIYQAAGLPAIFVLRFASLLLFAGVFCYFAVRWRVASHPLSWLMCLLGLLMAYTGTFPKPELFSYVFLVLLLATWFWIKTSGEEAWKYCYFLPTIMLLWANCHAGVQVGMTLLGIVALGEVMSFWLSSNKALDRKVIQHFLIAVGLSGVAMFVTPYGWEYPLSLVEKVTARNYAELRSVHAFVSVFDKRAESLPFEEYFYAAIAIVTLVSWRRWKWRDLDWGLVLVNLFFCWFYTLFIRSTYYWGPIFAFSGLHLLATRSSPLLWPLLRSRRLLLAVLVMSTSVGMAGMVGYDSFCRESLFRYVGFGDGYPNAVEEARFIRDYLPQYKVGNSYDAGGYLLWELWPERKVFIDPRYFPFKSWYADYLDFVNGSGIETLLHRFPADAWFVRYVDPAPVSWFVEHHDWEVGFYGPSGVVFVQDYVSLPPRLVKRSAAIDHVRNHHQALQIMIFECKIMDFDSAQKTLAMMRECFSCPNERSTTGLAQSYLLGMRAFHQQNFKEAEEHLRKGWESKMVYNDAALTQTYHHLAAEAWQRAAYQDALGAAEEALAVRPTSLYGLYNAGIIQWYLHQTLSNDASGGPPVGIAGESGVWRQRLNLFLQLAEGAPQVPDSARRVARAVLSGRYSGRPQVLVPVVEPYQENARALEPGVR